jgi:regulator of sigma E protease
MDQEARTEPVETSSGADRTANWVLTGVFVLLAIFRWDIVKGLGIFFITLGVLVAIHEWGHFIAAKSVGVYVYEFAIGMGKKLTTYMRRGETEYTLRMLPIGGFVNPKGMQPDDPITSDGLNGRRPAERALVYLAGPLMNMILTVVVLCTAGAIFGTPDKTTVLVGDVTRKSAASKMQVVSRNGQPDPKARPGLQLGDRVLEVNGKPVRKFETVTGEINPSVGKEVTLKVQRGKDEVVLTGVPAERTISQEFLTVASVPPGTALAVQPGDQIDQINGEYPEPKDKESPVEAVDRVLRENAGQEISLHVWRNSREYVILRGPASPIKVEVSPGTRTIGALGFVPISGQGPRVSLGESFQTGLGQLQAMAMGMAALFSKPKNLGQSVGGPIAIWALLSQMDKLPLMYYFNILAQLSFSLAVFNLLPVPNLDGGHMLLLTLEVIRRRRLEPQAQKAVAMVGLAIIGVLFVLIMSKDILKHLL